MRTSKKEQTREKIQQAAYQCVARYGFEKTTLDDIAREVNLNKASLYYYYKNKEDIFLDVTTTATRRFVESLQASTLEIPGGPAAQIRHYLLERSFYFIRLVADVHISEETLRQVEPRFQDLVRDVAEREAAFLAERIAAAMSAGEVTTPDAGRLAANLITLAEGIKEKAKAQAAGEARDQSSIMADIRENLEFMLAMILRYSSPSQGA